MAVLANRTSGNFTSSSTWALVENSTWQNILALQESGTTATTTTYQTGTVFTVPTTQTIQGVLLKVQTNFLKQIKKKSKVRIVKLIKLR